MTDNNNNQQEIDTQPAEQQDISTNNLLPEDKKTTGTGGLRQGGLYAGLKISHKAANIASFIAVMILVLVIIFAVATADGHTISFDSNGGTDVESIQVDYGVYGEIDAVSTREGYTFDGWYFDEALTSEYDPEVTIESDITLYAKWIANE